MGSQARTELRVVRRETAHREVVDQALAVLQVRLVRGVVARHAACLLVSVGQWLIRSGWALDRSVGRSTPKERVALKRTYLTP